MTYTNLVPRTENKTGADLTGATGETGRTYTLLNAGVLSSGIQVILQNAPLHEGVGLDFTVSGQIVTINVAVDDDMLLSFYYFTVAAISTPSPLVTSTTLRYATPLQLASILGVKNDVPSWSVGTTPSKEEVGTGDNSTGEFYLDHRNVISDSYTIYYGATAATTTELTETTHYVLSMDSGKITLTTAGKTFLGTNKIYAEYSYVSIDLSDSYLIDVLGRSEQEIDSYCRTTFTNGSATNPAYPLEEDYWPSQGSFNRSYFSEKRPVIDLTSTINGDVSAAAASIVLATGDGAKFPSTGYVLIDTEVVYYGSISTDTLGTLTRGAWGSTAAAHTSGADVHSTVVMVSDTSEGTDPVWQALAYDTDFVVDEMGKIYIYSYQIVADSVSSVYTLNGVMAQQGVENRLRAKYLYGFDTVPVDITRLTLLIAKRMLIADNIGKSLIQGRNEFKPEMANADAEEIERIKSLYVQIDMGNT